MAGSRGLDCDREHIRFPREQRTTTWPQERSPCRQDRRWERDRKQFTEMRREKRRKTALGTRRRCGRLLSVSRVEPFAGDFLMRLTESIQEDSPHAKSGGLSLGPLRLRRVCLGLWGVRARAVRINLQATRLWRARVICRGSYPPLADGLRSGASREPRFSGHRRHGWTKEYGNNLALVHCPPQGERPNSKCNGALLSYAK